MKVIMRLINNPFQNIPIWFYIIVYFMYKKMKTINYKQIFFTIAKVVKFAK